MATLTATYDPVLARVRLAASSLPATADVALFEVSIDQKHWSQVRGGAAVPILSTAAGLDDYEFAPGVPNYYRVSAIDLSPPTFVASTAAVNAVGVSVTPSLPTYLEGDLLLVFATIRNSGAGTVVCPTGYTVMLQVDNIGLFGKRAGVAGSESAPVVNVTGGVIGVAGSDVIAQMAAFRNLERAPASTAYQLNPAGQNIAYPGLAAVQASWAAALVLGWKADDWASVATVAGGTEIGEPVSTAGLDAGMVWDYLLMVSGTGAVLAAPVATGALVVTGGTSVISYGAAVALRSADFVTRTSVAVTPNMTVVWLKFPAAPYLNRPVILTDWAEFSRTSRVTPYSVVSQRDASAVSDYASPRTVTVNFWAETLAEIAALDLVLSVGGVMLLHTPVNVQLASMYAAIGDYTYTKPAHLSHKAAFSVPLTQVTPPDLSLVGNMVTWATLITNYSTWQDVINANATWTTVLALMGNPVDVLVGH